MPKQYIDYMSSINNDTGSLEKRYYRDQEARDAIQQGLATKLNSSVVGQPNGVASLDSNGVVPSSQLPSFVDTIEEYETIESFPEEGEASTIYVDLDTNIKYRWSGTQYVEISASLALGETSSTAYRGDRGAEAYQHAADPNKTSTSAPSGLYKIAVTNQGHVASVSDVTKSDITNLGIPAQDTTYQEATTSSPGLMSALDKTKLNNIPNNATTNTGTVEQINTGVGLTGGPVTVNGTIKAKLKSETLSAQAASAPTHVANRQYPVVPDSSGNLSVNVPWLDGVTSINGQSGDITLTPADIGAAASIHTHDPTSINGVTGITDNSVPTPVSASDTNLITARTLYNAGYSKTNGTVTSVTAGAGLTGGQVTGSGTIALAASGATQGTYGPINNTTGNDGQTVSIPNLTVDQYGRITNISNKTYTSKNTTYTNATQNANGLMSAGDKVKIDNAVFNGYGTCSSGANEQHKVVTVANQSWALAAGSVVGVKFANTNTYSATFESPITLNVNGSGDKPIWYDHNENPTGDSPFLFGYKDRITYYMYNGTHWVWLSTGISLNDIHVPTKISDLTNDANYITMSAIDAIKGKTNGLATLDEDGRVPSTQLPSYVDDVLEFDTFVNFPPPDKAEANKIYIATDTNMTYRWGGSRYVSLATTLALGETHSTAYYGDRGKAAYDHAVEEKILNPQTEGLYKISVTQQGHIKTATPVTKQDIVSLGIPEQDTQYTSKPAHEGGDELSLVTTGEKAIWNSKGDSSGSVTKISTGIGLTGGDITSEGTIKANLANEAALTSAAQDVAEAANRTYPVRVDVNGKLAVNIPWTDDQDISGKLDTSEKGAPNGIATLDNASRIPANQMPLNTFVPVSEKGSNNGVAELDATGKVPSGQIPASAFNVVEEDNLADFPVEGKENCVYVERNTNYLYRWNGSAYINISSPEGVKYTAQDLTAEQKAQARTNIGAAFKTDTDAMSEVVSDLNDRLNNFGNFVRNIEKTESGINVEYDNNSIKAIQTGLVFDGGYVDENNYLYLKNGDVVLSNDVYTPIQLPAGGGGGGSGSSIALTNVVKPVSVRNGQPALFSFTATSSDDTDITVVWYVDGKEITSQNDVSGSTFSFNAQNYLKPSAKSNVRAAISSVGDASLSRQWSIESIAFSIAWGGSVEKIMLNSSNTNVYVPIEVSAEANTSNIVTVSVNNHVVTRTTTGSQTLTVLLDKSYFLPGANTITASMRSAADVEDKADDISYILIWGFGVTAPVVAFAESEIDCTQYDLVDVQYFVFDPNNEIATCTLQVGLDEPITQTVAREISTYQYPAMTDGTVNITLRSGSASATTMLVIAHSDYNLNYYSDDSLVYVLDPIGHSNTDSDRELFGNLIFNGGDPTVPFDWENGGFKSDINGVPAFVIKKGNTVQLPRGLFEDVDTNGKTIDISFRITNSDQYDAVAMSELNSNSTKGIILRANNGELRLNNSTGQIFRYCEDSRIDLSVLVEKESEAQRLSTVWLDGIPSSVNKYTSNMLVHDEGSLLIGSAHCDVWIYAIRIYNSHLTKSQMIQNYISLGNTTTEKIQRFQTNTILGEGDSITMEALHRAVPNLTIVHISTPRMTVDKKDNVPADITITDGSTVLELAAASGPDAGDGTVFKVQGTSSAAYGRSSLNMDIDFKGTGKKYKISENAIAVNYLNIKVNVASSENANNINAVDWYNTYQPYITEPRQTPGVRDTVEGKPCAVFITNTGNESVWFSSQLVPPGETILYAMGDLCNSKKNKDVFGQNGEGEHYTKACIEVSGNDTEPQRFRSTAAVFNPEADDGDGRWETTEIIDGEQTTVKHFEWRMKPKSADKNEVVQSWNELVAWVVSTINNSAKFKREIGNYFAVDSLLYHFLFIEYFAAYDNVSKNTFYSYDWDENAQKYLWNIKAAYDMDTILAADNDGKPLGDYGLDYGDTIEGTPDGRQYFNAADNPIWVNIKAVFQSELAALYTSLRSAGAWNAQAMMDKWDIYQSKRPRAAMIVDAYNKYIKPYKTTDVIINNEVKGSDDSYLPRLQGSKTYWRRQFLTYQTAYMDGKYGYYSKTNSTQFRTNCASGTRTFAVKVYAKTYITIIVDDNKVGNKKVNAGEVVTFDNVSVGNNTTLYVTPDRLIEYIRPLNNTQNSTFAASGAAKLMEAILGGDDINTAWPAGTGVTIPSVILKDFSIRNISNFSDALDLSANVELETLDTRNTNAGIITLPSFAPLRTIQLNACTGLNARNLKSVESFSMQGGEHIISLILENCNSTISSAIVPYLIEAVNSSQVATRRIRAIGVNWTFNNLDVLNKIATSWKGYNALGQPQDKPVVTGVITVTNISKKKLEVINNIWGEGNVDDHLDENTRTWQYGDLTIRYTSLIPYYAVSFLNMDNTPIKDKLGQNYIQYIDRNGEAYDPIEAGEIDTPTYVDETGQYRYTFTEWDNLEGSVASNKTVIAVYTREIITYTVRWYDKEGGEVLDERLNVAYGSEAVYDPAGTIGLPSLADEEISGVYKVFTGWDKSTGFVKSNIDVYAVWDRASIPAVGSKELKNMSVAEIYGITKSNLASTYFEDEDYIDIQVGKDFSFSNVQSQTLLENRYFNGSQILRMNTVKLFDENAPSFTLAVDYEFTESTTGATLISCCGMDNTTQNEGFRVQYYLSSNTNENQSVKVKWGDNEDIVAHGLNRGILVIRHRKGSKNLLIASDNGGRYIPHSESYGGDVNNNGYKYDGYNPEIHYGEIPRTQETITDGVLSFGASAFGTSGYTNPAKGWIHWCKIWYDDLGANAVRELASWPHETWRMQYRGSGIYNKGDGTGLKDNASFIANAPLSQFYDIYPGDTTGGWKNSLLRAFVSTRVFNAFPYSWKALICPVNIATKGGADNYNSLEYTIDKIYVASIADVSSVSTGLHSSEGQQISWLNENKYRVKFMGINIPENANIITNTSTDPTLYTETYNVKEGDIWIKSNDQSSCYIYISSDTAQKHAVYGGRQITDTANNINASDGGVWVRSITYWVRSNGVTQPTNAYSQYAVYPSGQISTIYVDYKEYQSRGVVPMFSV